MATSSASSAATLSPQVITIYGGLFSPLTFFSDDKIKSFLAIFRNTGMPVHRYL